jgi:chromosome segregation ATPase
MNKEGIEIMSDINLHVGVLEMELENCNEMLAESMREVDCLKEQLSVALAERDQADNKVNELQTENNNLQEELDMEKEENELYMEYLDVGNAEEAKRLFKRMKNEIDELERKNEQLKFENSMHVKDLLKIKKKAIGDGLEYLLD